jgi:hypothetical protein
MASSSKGRGKGCLPQSDSSSTSAAAPATEKAPGKKKKTVRMSREQIDSYLSWERTPPLLPMEGPRRFIEKFSQDMLDRMSKDTLEGLAAFDLYKINQTFAEINKLDDDLAAEVEDVR